MAIGGDGSITLAGSFSNTTDFGLGPLVSAGEYDACLVKLDSAGGERDVFVALFMLP